MKEPYSEGVANHAGLEPCAGGGGIAGEALTEAVAGRLSSREILPVERRRTTHAYAAAESRQAVVPLKGHKTGK